MQSANSYMFRHQNAIHREFTKLPADGTLVPKYGVGS